MNENIWKIKGKKLRRLKKDINRHKKSSYLYYKRKYWKKFTKYLYKSFIWKIWYSESWYCIFPLYSILKWERNVNFSIWFYLKKWKIYYKHTQALIPNPSNKAIADDIVNELYHKKRIYIEEF